VTGGERKPARSDQIEPIGAADFPDHRADRAATQRFLHRPQHVAGFRRGNRHQLLGKKPEIIETGAVGRAVLAEPHLLGDPEQRARLLGAASNA
jgi:hypothetical protein